MNKKIIAVLCVVVLMASIFVACVKKPKEPTITINNQEYILATDAEGNTIINENGDIAVHPNNNGEIITNENGEPQTNYVEVPEKIIFNNKIETKTFSFNIPEGYTAQEDGRIKANGSSDVSYISISLQQELDNEEDYTAFMTAQKNIAKGIYDEIKKDAEVKADLDVTTKKITSKDIDSDVIVFNAEGKGEEYHTINIYFVYDGNIYSAFYCCNDETYSEDFDFVKFVTENLTWK